MEYEPHRGGAGTWWWFRPATPDAPLPGPPWRAFVPTQVYHFLPGNLMTVTGKGYRTREEAMQVLQQAQAMAGQQ